MSVVTRFTSRRGTRTDTRWTLARGSSFVHYGSHNVRPVVVKAATRESRGEPTHTHTHLLGLYNGGRPFWLALDQRKLEFYVKAAR